MTTSGRKATASPKGMALKGMVPQDMALRDTVLKGTAVAPTLAPVV